MPRALRIARAIVSGLQAVHEVGVVHRDLKPENIRVEGESRAVVMDFGIAHSTGRESERLPTEMPTMVRQKSAVVRNQTMLGTVVGTVTYMSPEQARGEPVDQRSDIYSLGLIFYDMLVGRTRIGPATDPKTELQARCDAPLRHARAINPDIPEPVDAIVSKCVQPEAAQRYQTSAELMADLERLDDNGKRLPFTRRVTRLQLVVAGLVIVGLLAGTWQATRWFTPAAPVEKQSVPVLIADFENTTNDPVFDGTLEQAFALAMEDASFISTYPRASAMTVVAQLKPGTTRLDENLARLVVQREPDIKVVLAGRVEKAANGYRVSVRAVDPVPGTTLAEDTRSADTKGEVLQVLAPIAASIREALGDTKSETERITANESFTAASLEAARDYSHAQRLANSGRDEEAMVFYDRAIKQDPNLGRAYASMALSAGKLGRTQEAEALWKQALSKLDRMTERERYRTLGIYYMQVLGNDELALEHYRTLVQKFPADGAAHNNLAITHFRLLDFTRARQQGAEVLKIYPQSILYQYNYSLYAMYAGDWAAAEKAATYAAQNPDAPPAKAFFVLAMAALVRGDAAAAVTAYENARSRAGARGASLASIGLADLTMYQGRYAEAEQILTAGIAGDLVAKNAVNAAAKFVALAEAQLALRKNDAALASAHEALKLLRTESVMVPVARVFAAGGKEREARALGVELEGRLQPRSRSYGKLIAGELALRHGQVAEAVDAFRASQQLVDQTATGGNKGYWLARFNLGIAYVLAGSENAAAAIGEFQTCVKRQGEAAAVFLDDVPTYRYFVPLPYWMARAQETLSASEAAKNYQQFLQLRPVASGDPLAADAQARLAKTK